MGGLQISEGVHDAGGTITEGIIAIMMMARAQSSAATVNVTVAFYRSLSRRNDEPLAIPRDLPLQLRDAPFHHTNGQRPAVKN